MIKRILIGLGGTPFTPVAIERAVELAKQHEASLKAVTVVNENRVCKLGPVPPGAGFYAKRMCEKRIETTQDMIEACIADLQEQCENAGVDLTIEQETGDAFTRLIDHARYHDVTIFGLRSLFDHPIVHSPEKDLIRLLSRGVRPILAVSAKFRKINRVMVAYSGSVESANAMRHFVRLSPWPDAAVEIVHIGDDREKGSGLLTDAAAFCSDHGYAVETRLIPGLADKRLLATADEIGADLVVMGRNTRNLVARRVLGDTLVNTLKATDRPLFLSQ